MDTWIQTLSRYAHKLLHKMQAHTRAHAQTTVSTRVFGPAGTVMPGQRPEDGGFLASTTTGTCSVAHCYLNKAHAALLVVRSIACWLCRARSVPALCSRHTVALPAMQRGHS